MTELTQDPSAMNETTSGPMTTFACRASESFGAWLAAMGGSLAVTTYQAGKVLLIGWDGQQITMLPRNFDKPMGMTVEGNRMALVTRHDVMLFANAPLLAHAYLEDKPGYYDSLFLPRASYHTGDLHLHDVAFGAEGLWMVNTRFSCLAGVSHDYCFVPRWKPPFISELVPEDRCHLNGMAMIDGKPRYVTAHGDRDVVGGWRERKADGGVLIDVDRNEVLIRGLSMPHSPRWHSGALYLLNSGKGEFWRVDPNTGRHEVISVSPGYLRGLDFVGPYAIVGHSHIREKHIFGGLPVQDRFESLRCAIVVIDLRDGREIASLDFTAGCTELFAIEFMPGFRRPAILSLEKEATKQAFPARDFSYWLRPSSLIPMEDDKMGTASSGGSQ